VPKDYVRQTTDFLFRDQMSRAEDFVSKTQPEFFNEGNPDEVQDYIKETARALYVKEAQERGGVSGKAQAAVGARIPTDALEVGLGQINPNLRGVNVGLAAKVPDLLGFGPESIEDSPAGAAASAASTLASTLIPPLMPMGLATRLGPAATRAATVAQSIGIPAFAGGAAGGIAGGIDAAMNPPSDIVVNSDSAEPDAPARIFAHALKEAQAQAIIEGGGSALGLGVSSGFRGIAQFAKGNRQFFDNALESLRIAGIRGENISLQDVTDRGIITSGTQTLGVMPIPFIQAQFGAAVERKSVGLSNARDEMLNTISPTFSIIRGARGTDPVRYDRAMRRATRGAFRKVERAVERYRTVRQPLDQSVQRELRMGNYTSAAASTRVTALNLMNQRGVNRQLPNTVDPNTGTLRAMEPRADMAEPVVGILGDIARMPGGANQLVSLVNLRNDVRKVVNATTPNNPLQAEDRAALFSIEAALDDDITSAIANSGNPALVRDYARLNELDSTWITLIRGHVGQRAKMVDETFGRQALSEAAGGDVGIRAGQRALQRNQGSTDQEDFLGSMLDNASPEEMRQFGMMMRSLGPSGERTMRFAVAKQLDKAIEGATVRVDKTTGLEAIKPERLEKLMESDPDGKGSRRFWSLVDEAGVDRAELRNFTRAASILWRNLPADTNKYIARSVILSGAKNLPSKLTRMMTAGLLGSGGATAAAAGGPPGTAGVILGAFLLESYTALATSPTMLRWVQRALDPSYGTGARAQVIERIVSDNLFRTWYSGKLREVSGEMADMTASGMQSVGSVFGSEPSTTSPIPPAIQSLRNLPPLSSKGPAL